MAIFSSSSYLSHISASFTRTRFKTPHLFSTSHHPNTLSLLSKRSFPRLTISSHLPPPNSSNPSNSNSPDPSNSNSSDPPIPPDPPIPEFHHKLPLKRGRKGVPVFVTLPVEAVGKKVEVQFPKRLKFTFSAFALAGIEGVVMEIWWARAEKEPMEYSWTGYLEIVKLAQSFGLKVRVVLGFYEYGEPRDRIWIPLPDWVLREMANDPVMAYMDRFGRKSYEYISLACDTLPVLNGRSPLQAYSDFMRSFRDTFEEFLGVIITGVQVGMGPAGELRYPAASSNKMTRSWRFRELGEFQCYDHYMHASLDACAQDSGIRGWGLGGPFGTGSLIENPEETEFFRNDGSWNLPYGRFFLEWYSGMLLLHGERLCMAAESVFRGSGVTISSKVAGAHWHYSTKSHASELTAGYYNTSNRDGYLPIIHMFGRHGVTLCCNCFEMKDKEEKPISPLSSPEGWLRQILLAAKASDLPIDCECSAERISADSLKHVLEMAKFYSDGLEEPIFSFNLVRLNPNLLAPDSWVRITEFVKQMSDVGNFQSKLEDGGGDMYISSTSVIEKGTAAIASC